MLQDTPGICGALRIPGYSESPVNFDAPSLAVGFVAGFLIGGGTDRILFPVVFAFWARLVRRRDDGE